MTKPKCYGCDKRYVGCHADCIDYKLFNEERQLIAKKRLENGSYADYRESKYRRIHRDK